MLAWAFLLGLIGLLLWIDLGSTGHSQNEAIAPSQAGRMTALWVSLALLFSAFIWIAYHQQWVANPEGKTPAQQTLTYLTGYLIELSLSVDNLFVMALIFKAFRIPAPYQHRVLFWGILGALGFRGLLIGLGALLIQQLHFLLYVFAVFLIYTAIKMLFKGDDDVFQPKKSKVYQFLRRYIPMTTALDGAHFWVQRRHIRAATPLFMALVLIEIMDVVFALDSVPAIFSISTDAFIVFSASMMAVLGLRAMYFFLAHWLERFAYLEYSLVAILLFVGLKMLLAQWIPIAEWQSLLFIFTALLAGIWISLRKTSTSS